MGGNIFKHLPTTRLDKKQYWKLAFHIGRIIQAEKERLGLDTRYDVIASYSNKPDFGDLDIIITPNFRRHVGDKKLQQLLNSPEYSSNGNVISYAVPVDDNPLTYFQVDLIYTKFEIYDFALNYYAFNDLGNLIGRIAHKMGLKFGHNGLWLSLRDGTHLFKTILVTDDFFEALKFLGFDVNKYKSGFDELEDIFMYVVRSRYFDVGAYLMENRNHTDRTRDAKRPTYTKFLKWLTENNIQSNYTFVGNKSQWLKTIFAVFPKAGKEYAVAQSQLKTSKDAKLKFNGDIVSQLTGLSGKDLGKYMAIIREANQDQVAFHHFLINNNQETVNEYILSFGEKYASRS